jgi:hypothetical protein
MKKDKSYKDKLVYQVLLLKPGDFNYIVVASSLNKELIKETYKSLVNEGKACKFEAIDYKGKIINNEY